VRWLDRYRRSIAILAAFMVAPLVLAKLTLALGGEWPRMHVTALSVMIGIGAWCAFEIALAWVTAVWETEHSLMLRDRKLPRAILLRRR
jgi:hypothetical protein